MERQVWEFQDWGRRTRQWSNDTCKSYSNRARSWLAWCREHNLRPARATPRDIEQWITHKPLSPHTRTGLRTAVLAYYEWLQATGKVKANPVRDVRRPSIPRSVPRSLRPESVQEVIAAARAHSTQRALLVGLMAYAGLRITEARTLRWVDVEHHDQWLRVLGKGRQERMLPVHPGLRKLIVAWRSSTVPAEWVFPGRYGGPLSLSAALDWTNAALDEAGHPEATPHWLRHSMARRMVERGIPLPDVQAALGHTTLSSTTIYTRARPESVQAAVASLDW